MSISIMEVGGLETVVYGIVELIASGYEWTCPDCDTLNHEIETEPFVKCGDCTTTWQVTGAYHAEG